MELLLMLDAARHASAAQVTAVIPHYAYARSDKKDASRISIGGRLVARVIVGERRADRRVVDGEDLVARQREQLLDAGCQQRVDEERGAGRHQKIASGCAGAPVAPTSRIGVAVNRNS